MPIAQNKELMLAIQLWCLAYNEWAEELYGGEGGGFPRTQTRANLYYAGRELFAICGVDPNPVGLYGKNKSVERETPRDEAKS